MRTTHGMTVERIWRYPIKSTAGELLTRAHVDGRAIEGDRLHAVRDAEGKLGSGKNTRRFRRMPRLLRLRSGYPGGLPTAAPELLDPDGRPVRDPTAYLRDYLGRADVELAAKGSVSHFDQLPLSLLTTATLDWLRAALPGAPVDERRFRPNLLIRTPPGTPPFVEDSWIGGTARLGDTVRITVERSSERCAMVDEAQSGLPGAPGLLHLLARAHDLRLDALATVSRPGEVRLGDAFALDP